MKYLREIFPLNTALHVSEQSYTVIITYGYDAVWGYTTVQYHFLCCFASLNFKDRFKLRLYVYVRYTPRSILQAHYNNYRKHDTVVITLIYRQYVLRHMCMYAVQPELT